MCPYDFAIFNHFIADVKFQFLEVLWLVIFSQTHQITNDQTRSWLIFYYLSENLVISGILRSHLAPFIFIWRRHLFHIEHLLSYLKTHHLRKRLFGLKLSLKVDIYLTIECASFVLYQLHSLYSPKFRTKSLDNDFIVLHREIENV